MDSEIITITSYSIHKTKYSEVCVELITINKNPYIGFSRHYLPTEDVSDSAPVKLPRSIFIPLEAWENQVLKKAVPKLKVDSALIKSLSPTKSTSITRRGMSFIQPCTFHCL